MDDDEQHELKQGWRVSSFCSTSGACRDTLVTNHVISHEWEKDRIAITTNGTYPWSFVTQIFRNRNGQPSQEIYYLLINDWKITFCNMNLREKFVLIMKYHVWIHFIS